MKWLEKNKVWLGLTIAAISATGAILSTILCDDIVVKALLIMTCLAFVTAAFIYAFHGIAFGLSVFISGALMMLFLLLACILAIAFRIDLWLPVLIAVAVMVVIVVGLRFPLHLFHIFSACVQEEPQQLLQKPNVGTVPRYEIDIRTYEKNNQVIFFDFGLYGKASLIFPSCQYLAHIRFPFESVSRMMDEKEAEKIERIVNRIGMRNTVFAGTVLDFVAQEMSVYLYFAPRNLQQVKKQAYAAALREGKTVSSYETKEDIEFQTYYQLLSPEPRMLMHIRNEVILERMADDRVSERMIFFELHFPDESSADKALTDLKESEFTLLQLQVASMEVESKKPVRVVVQKSSFIGQARIDCSTDLMMDIAHRYQGKFIGWGIEKEKFMQ